MKALCLAALLAASASAGHGACRLALSLGLDVSGSVDAAEYRLQLDGIASALETADVQAALFEMPQANVSLSVFQWGGSQQQQLLVDWTDVTTLDDLSFVTKQLRSATPTFDDPQTAIGAAIEFGLVVLAEKPECWMHTLDISGDGPSSSGPAPLSVMLPDQPITTINGLVVNPNGRDNITKDLTYSETLLDHYQTQVIRGPGAFVETAVDFHDFENAMTRKLTRELNVLLLSWQTPPHRTTAPQFPG